MTGWRDGLGPWEPVLEGDRLYGRGGADDGYAAFASLTAIEAVQAAGGTHARCVVLIEASEESGSPDLPAHVDALADRIGTPSLVVCLDSGCATTTGCGPPRRCAVSLDGDAAGRRARPRACTRARPAASCRRRSGSCAGCSTASRTRDTGRVLVPELSRRRSPTTRRRQTAADRRRARRASSRSPSPATPARSVATAGRAAAGPAPGSRRSPSSAPTASRRPTGRQRAAALHPSSRCRFRLPPTADPRRPPAALTDAPRPPTRPTAPRSPSTADAGRGRLGRAADRRRGCSRGARRRRRRRPSGRPRRPSARAGRSRSWACSAQRFPDAQFLVTGVLGPGSNAHGPNEFLHLADRPAHHRRGRPRPRRPRPPVTAAPGGAGWRPPPPTSPSATPSSRSAAALADRGRGRAPRATRARARRPSCPLALLDEPWRDGHDPGPRTPPARRAGRGHPAWPSLLGEPPGGRVGWRMRQDTKVSARTEIEVVTEGVLTRRLQRDPDLAGVSAVRLRRVPRAQPRRRPRPRPHPRGRRRAPPRPADRGHVGDARHRPGRRAARRARSSAPRAGRTRSRSSTSTRRASTAAPARTDPAVAAAVAPGAARPRRRRPGLPARRRRDRPDPAGARRPRTPDVDVRPLHGALPPAEQDAAIAPAPPGRRKVVLATSIAETSLTIEGVTVVVDAGWRRTPRLDAGSGMTRLVTLPVTRAEADQRAGGPADSAPGTAYRLWSAAEHAALRTTPSPRSR